MPARRLFYISESGVIVRARPSEHIPGVWIVTEKSGGDTYQHSTASFKSKFKKYNHNKKRDAIMAKNTNSTTKPSYTVRPKRYVSSTGREVRAIKVTEKNYVQVHNWIEHFDGKSETKVNVDKHGDLSQHRVSVKTPKGIRVARVGEWVILERDVAKITFKVAKDEFDREYKLVTK